MNIKIAGLTKSQIRSKILAELKTQYQEERNRKSRIIKDKLFNSEVFKKAKVVMFYISFGGEVDTRDMIKEAQNLSKTVTVPVCCGKNRAILKPSVLSYDARFRTGPYGVREPVVERFIPLEDLDLVLVPGLAFDKKGNRLGRGKGCYDRLLSRLSEGAASIGLAFDFQILPAIPVKAHDISVNRVIFA